MSNAEVKSVRSRRSVTECSYFNIQHSTFSIRFSIQHSNFVIQHSSFVIYLPFAISPAVTFVDGPWNMALKTSLNVARGCARNVACVPIVAT